MIPIEVVRALYAASYQGHYANLSGEMSPRQSEAWERANSPRRGDLVIEISAGPRMWGKDEKRGEELRDAIGWLVDIQPVHRRRQDDSKIEQYATRWVIRTLDGKEFSWTNACIVAVPTDWNVNRWLGWE